MPHINELKDLIAEKVLISAKDAYIITTKSESGTPAPTAWLFDFRALMLDPVWLNLYAEIFWEKYAEKLPFQVGGMETAGIPLVSAIVMKSVERGTPVNGFYIRKSRKREGLLKRIEGTLTDHPVILVDDLMNSGGSILQQLKVLDDVPLRVRDIFCILAFRTRDAYPFVQERAISLTHLFTLPDFGIPLLTTKPPIAETLNVVWKFAPGTPGFEHVIQKSSPALDDTRIYYGTDKGTFYAIEQSDGAIAWEFETRKHPPRKGIFSSPALHKGIVYFGGYDGSVYALDTMDGTKRWEYTGADWLGSSPALAPVHGLLYIGLEYGLFRKRGGIAALDMKTGTEVWRDRTPALTHGSPRFVPEEDMVVIGSNDGVVYAYDARTGVRRWVYQTEGDIKMQPAYDSLLRRVYVTSMDSKLYALGARTGDVLWAYQTGGPLYTTPLIVDDLVIIASLDKSVYALDTVTGKKRWEFETNGRIFASPVLADASLWIGSNDGKLYELDPTTGKSRGFFQASERIIGKVAYNEKTERIFATTIANEVYALRRKP